MMQLQLPDTGQLNSDDLITNNYWSLYTAQYHAICIDSHIT